MKLRLALILTLLPFTALDAIATPQFTEILDASQPTPPSVVASFPAKVSFADLHANPASLTIELPGAGSFIANRVSWQQQSGVGYSALHAAEYAGSLSAQFTGFTPDQPRAGSAFHANVLSGPCEYLNPDPASATLVSQANGVVTIRIPGAIDVSCNQAIAPLQYSVPALPAGNYRVDMVLYTVEFPGDVGTPAGYIGGRDVQVLATRSAITIPVLEVVGLMILALLVACLGLRTVQGKGD